MDACEDVCRPTLARSAAVRLPVYQQADIIESGRTQRRNLGGLDALDNPGRLTGLTAREMGCSAACYAGG